MYSAASSWGRPPLIQAVTRIYFRKDVPVFYLHSDTIQRHLLEEVLVVRNFARLEPVEVLSPYPQVVGGLPLRDKFPHETLHALVRTEYLFAHHLCTK